MSDKNNSHMSLDEAAQKASTLAKQLHDAVGECLHGSFNNVAAMILADIAKDMINAEASLNKAIAVVDSLKSEYQMMTDLCFGPFDRMHQASNLSEKIKKMTSDIMSMVDTLSKPLQRYEEFILRINEL